MEDEIEAIVIDAGSGTVKAGFAGEDAPRSIFPSVVGTVEDQEVFAKMNSTITAAPSSPTRIMGGNANAVRDAFVGTEAQEKREYLAMTSPIERGNVTDWDKMTQLWEYTFQHELHVNPEAVHMPVLITDSPLSSRENREQAAQIMFEKFRVPGFYVATQAVLSLFASGRTRGVVVESGDGVSHAVPVFEGYALPHAILRLDCAGSDITSHLRKMLVKEKPQDPQYKRMIDGLSDNVIRDIKENLCYVASTNLDDELSQNRCEDKAYELPDGTIIEISQKSQATCGEILFNPDILGDANAAPRGTGIHNIVTNSIAQCDSDLQNDLYSAVVIAGGTSMLQGFGRRLGNEISKVTTAGTNVRIVPDVQNRERGYNSQRKYAAWVGGSMFSSLPTFGMVQITKREWEDSHEAIIHRKCF